MPALPPVPGVLKFSFQHTVNAINAFVHQYYAYTGTGPSSTDAAALANSAKSAWATNIAGLCGTSVSLVQVQVTDLGSATGSQNVSSGATAGTRAGVEVPAACAVLINNHITRRYRGGKPRQYWPMGVAADQLNPQQWNSTLTAAVATGYNALVAAITALTFTGGNITGPRNISYFQGFTLVTSPTTGRGHNVAKLRSTPLVDVITSSSVNSRIASQRRRAHFSA